MLDPGSHIDDPPAYEGATTVQAYLFKTGSINTSFRIA